MMPHAALADDEPCPCGRPLHYSHSRVRVIVDQMIAQLGPTTIVQAPDGSRWAVPRHYIALHGLHGADIVRLAHAYRWMQIRGAGDGHHD